MKIIRRISYMILIAPIILSLQACPVDLDYPLQVPGTYPIDENLTGTWSNLGNLEDIEMTDVCITALDDHLYEIEVLGTTDLYQLEEIKFTGWIAKVDGNNFLVIRGSEGFYHYWYKIENNQVTIYSMALLEGGKDAVISTESLYSEVYQSLKKPGFFEEPQLFEKK